MAIINWFMDFIYKLAEWALMLLPDSPFQNDGWVSGLQGFEKIMSYINYFIPVGTMVLITSAYISAVIVWYVVRWVLRLAQYID